MKKNSYLFSVIILLFLSPVLFAGKFDRQFALNGLSEEINEARQSLYDVYYELVKQDFFDLSYNNNIILDVHVDEHANKNSEITLALVEWLDKRNDRDSRFLLRKINKLYYLELHHLLCKKDFHQNPGARIVSLCQDIYQFSIPMPGVGEGQWEMPFRTCLTKVSLLISLINRSSMGYGEKKEAMAYALGRVKQEMLSLNNTLASIKSIDEAIIKEFIELLQIHAIYVPVVKPTQIKTIILALVLLSAATGVSYYIYKRGLPRIWQDFSNSLENLWDKLMQRTSKGLVKGLVDESKKDGGVEYELTPEAAHILEVMNGKFDDKFDKVKELVKEVLDHADEKVDDKLQKLLGAVKDLENTVRGAQDGMSESWIGGLLTKKNAYKKQ